MQAHAEVLIAIVDDDNSFRVAMEGLIRSLGYRAVGYSSGEEFMKSGMAVKADCIVSDVQMSGMTGIEMKRRLNADGIDVAVIFVTAHTDVMTYEQAIDCGAMTVLHKPFEGQALIDELQAALDL